jgi:hypothetical protein
VDADASIAEPPYKKNRERRASLQDRLSKVQKTAESLLATVSGTGDYTDKLVYTDVDRVKSYLNSAAASQVNFSMGGGPNLPISVNVRWAHPTDKHQWAVGPPF